jgi:hypothetical protein
VLGSRYHGLEDLTKLLNGRHLLNDADWREQVTTAADLLKAGDSDIRVSFALDGLPGQTPDGILHQAVLADMRGTATATQWELATMKYAGVLDKINWYQGGRAISNPFGS